MHIYNICNDPANNDDYEFIKKYLNNDLRSDIEINKININTLSDTDFIQTNQNRFNLIYISNCDYEEWRQIKY